MIRRDRLWTAALLTGLLLVGAAVLALAVRAALQAADLAQQARSDLSAVQAQGLDLDAVAAATRRSTERLDRAEALLLEPVPRAVAAVPVLGRSWRAERAVVRAARSTAVAAGLAAERAAPLRAQGGGLDPAAVSRLAADLQPAVDTARRDLRTLRAVELGATPGQVSGAVAEAVEVLSPAVTSLSQAQRGAALAGAMLRGPRRLLVALENNAELRGTGGYVSSYALGQLAGGRLTLQPFQEVLDVADAPARARRVPAPPDYRTDFGPFLADTTLFRNWTMSPDVPASAGVGAAVAGRLLGTAPDVVVLLDVPALAAIVELSGRPVVVDGRPVAGADLVEVLLTDTYARAGTDIVDQAQRRQALQAAASGAVQDLLGGGLSPAALAPRFSALAAGRHLALWSARPTEQRALRALGLTGEVGAGCEDLALVSINNLSSNKLDYHVDRQVSVRARVGPRSTQVVQRVRLENQAPLDVVPYVAGTKEPGVARERVELSLGPAARDVVVTQDGEPVRATVRRSPGRVRAAVYLRLRRGAPVVVEVRYTLPRQGDAYRLRVLTQPLARDAGLSLDVAPVDGMRGTPVREQGLLSRDRLVVLDPPPLTLGERLRRFWAEPVRLPG